MIDRKEKQKEIKKRNIFNININIC